MLNEHGEEKYFVQGEIFTFGRKLHVYDRYNREVAFIKQELFNFLPTYLVYVNGREIARVRKEFSFFRPRFTVEGPGWDVEGSFWEHSYQITRHNIPVVTIEKEWMTWGDSYELNIANPADEIPALALVLTIDCVQEQQNNN